jgi:hypothetical protein
MRAAEVRQFVTRRIKHVLQARLAGQVAQYNTKYPGLDYTLRPPQTFKVGTNYFAIEQNENPVDMTPAVVVYPSGSTVVPASVSGYNDVTSDWVVAVGILHDGASLEQTEQAAQVYCLLAGQVLEEFLPTAPGLTNVDSPIYRVDLYGEPAGSTIRANPSLLYSVCESRIRVYTRHTYAVSPVIDPQLPAAVADARFSAPAVTLAAAAGSPSTIALEPGVPRSVGIPTGATSYGLQLAPATPGQWPADTVLYAFASTLPYSTQGATTAGVGDLIPITLPAPVTGVTWQLTLRHPVWGVLGVYSVTWL